MNRVKAVQTVIAKGRYVVTLDSGEQAFIKVSHSDQRRRSLRFRKMGLRERTCLEVLSGLAVPKLLDINPKSLRFLDGIPRSSFLACSAMGRAKEMDAAGLTQREMLAGWIFIVEHLTAFRRHQIILQDIKFNNALAQKKPFRIWLIDFEFAGVVKKGRHLKIEGFTRSFAAPETIRGKATSEQSLVYELGMILAYLLAHTDNNSLHTEGLTKALRAINKLKAREIGKIMADCLATNPNQRPRNFEEVFRRICAAQIPKSILVLWHKLRAPYAQRLEEVGLECLSSCVVCRKGK